MPGLPGNRQGRFVDLIEVDAASRTKVEDTRELLENVQYAPTHGRYKVYLIDEVHMLSTHSFNALLKTLEEPPPHVKFLLATTDPQTPAGHRVVPLSAIQSQAPAGLADRRTAGSRFWNRRGSSGKPPALALLARAGDGSLRDALSLLDQAIAFGGGRVGVQDVSAMLGSIDQRHVLHLLEALAAGEAEGVLQAIEELDQTAPDYSGVLAELISLLQRLALAQVVPVRRRQPVDPDALRRWPERCPGRGATVLPDRPARPARSTAVAGTARRLRDDPAADAGLPSANRRRGGGGDA